MKIRCVLSVILNETVLTMISECVESHSVFLNECRCRAGHVAHAVWRPPAYFKGRANCWFCVNTRVTRAADRRAPLFTHSQGGGGV